MNALILIDIQNDFLPTGTLPVPEGDKVVAVANRLMPAYDLVVATKDWHPAIHGSFAANHKNKKPGDQIKLAGIPQILWPTHCVQNTRGAEFAPGLNARQLAHTTLKGTNPEFDSYSGFFDNGHRHATDLHTFLNSRRAREIHLVGLATDYCVKFTALDARELGYEVHVILEGCRGVNLKPGDVDRAIEEMRAAGVKIVESPNLTAAA